MTRSELEHIIRAAGAISRDTHIVVIGSQSILGQFPDAPAELLRSIEADVFPLGHPDRSDLVDGAIGEGSQLRRHRPVPGDTRSGNIEIRGWPREGL